MRDGLVTHADRLAGELKAFFAEHRFSKRVRVGLATPRTVLRVIDLPPLDERDIRAALMMQAQERIPMPLDRAVMDFQTVGLVDTPDGQRLRVIVVVTEREGVDRLLDVLRRAGLRPEGVDLSIFAVIRALDRQRADARARCCTPSWETSSTSPSPKLACAALRGRHPRAWRWSSAAWPRTRRSRLMRRKRSSRARGPSRPAGHGMRQKAVADLLDRTAAELGSELRAAAEFYSTQFGSDVVTTGIVAGPLAPLPGFVQALAAASGLSLTCGEANVSGPDALGGVDSRLAPLASGLAVGELR